MSKNPYLAHYNKKHGRALKLEKDPNPGPLLGFLPRKVRGEQVQKALEHSINAFTNQPHSNEYRKLLDIRKNIPVYSQMDEFFTAFSEHQILVVYSQPGSGKTTQIPQFVVYADLPHVEGKMVLCTHPVDAAVSSFAERVADQLDVKFGSQVGYSRRFEDMSEHGTTFLKYTTDEILLTEIMKNPDLSEYSTIILDDSAHRRTLATDVLMPLLKTLCQKRPDLKIVVMLDVLQVADKFQKYFASKKSPKLGSLFSISSRRYPVEVFYTQEPEPDYLEASMRTVLMIHRTKGPGDILLFVPTENDIEKACRQIKFEVNNLRAQEDSAVRPLVCILLCSSLSPSPLQQQSMYDSFTLRKDESFTSARKLIIVDDVDNLFLCNDKIVYVVDSGFVVERFYNPRIRVQSLLASPISKTRALQRAIRAGKSQSGKCFRLYTEKYFKTELEDETQSEILKLELTTIVLKLVKFGIKDLVRFDWIDDPAPEALMRALEALNYLAALDDDGNLTPLGSIMAEFPLTPQLAKVLIASPEFQCSSEILTIVSMLSVPDIWIKPENQSQEFEEAKALLSIPQAESDHITLLNVYNQYVMNKTDKEWTYQHYLSLPALQEAEKIRAQLLCIMEQFEVSLVTLSDQQKLFSNIRQALVCGFFMQIAHKGARSKLYETIKDNQLAAIHPSCGLNGMPEWVLFHEFVLTDQPHIKILTTVKAEWLLEYAPLYFDLGTFPAGEAKKSLQRTVTQGGRKKKKNKSKKV